MFGSLLCRQSEVRESLGSPLRLTCLPWAELVDSNQWNKGYNLPLICRNFPSCAAKLSHCAEASGGEVLLGTQKLLCWNFHSPWSQTGFLGKVPLTLSPLRFACFSLSCVLSLFLSFQIVDHYFSVFLKQVHKLLFFFFFKWCVWLTKYGKYGSNKD